jgi:hypothetical protein
MLSHMSEGVHSDESRPARARATLEIDPDARAPEGELNAADGLRIAFAGWTELAAAIERWREHLSARHRGPSGVDASEGAGDVDKG